MFDPITFWFNVGLGWFGGFIIGVAYIKWKTRDWDQPDRQDVLKSVRVTRFNPASMEWEEALTPATRKGES